MAAYRSLRVLGAASLLVIGACACNPGGADVDRGEVQTHVGVTVSPDGAEGFTFKYAGQFADENGNFDFRQKGAVGNTIAIKFSIDPASVAGLKFKPDGQDAMWIVEKEKVGEGSPTGPYQGEQFMRFSTSADGLSLKVIDRNDDQTTYRYALRFDMNGQTIQHDPDASNGGDH